MSKKVLITLDGSELAECVVNYVEGLASSVTNATLLQVVSMPQGLPRKESGEDVLVMPQSGSLWHTTASTGKPGHVGNEYWYQDHEIARFESEAKDYLSNIAERLTGKGFEVKTEVLFGHPAEQILEYAEKSQVDMIAMSTHGRSGLGRWAHGSVADKVLRASPVPVLLVRAGVCGLA